MEHAPAAERRILRRATVAREPGFAIGTGAPGMDCCGGLFPGRTGGGPQSWSGDLGTAVSPFVPNSPPISWEFAFPKPSHRFWPPWFYPARGGLAGRVSVVVG